MKKNKKKLSISIFKNEDEERKFWADHDAVDYFDMDHPIKFDLSKLKPSTRPITVRLPESLISNLKILANKKDVPYQSLLKVYLAEKVREELRISANT